MELRLGLDEVIKDLDKVMTNLTGKDKIPKGQEISEDFFCP